MVSLNNRFIFDLFVLFWMPIIKNKKSNKLNAVLKIILLKYIFIFDSYFILINYKWYFWDIIFFAKYFDAPDKLKPALVSS